MKKNNSVQEKFPKLAKACQQNPTIQLHQRNSRPTIYHKTEIRAKNGFINKFCKD